MADIAEKCGVTKRVVSAVLTPRPNDTIRYSAATAARVHKAVAKLGYRINRTARQFGRSRHETIGALFRTTFLPHLPWGGCLALFLCVGVVAPMGDLFESVLKRGGHIKDSGFILPGHGGLLDRIDALLFAAPIVYAFKTYVF